MTKRKTVIVVILAAILLISAVPLSRLIVGQVQKKQKYADFDRHIERGSALFFDRDYANAYNAFMDAYDSLIPENDDDLAKKAEACLLAADCG